MSQPTTQAGKDVLNAWHAAVKGEWSLPELKESMGSDVAAIEREAVAAYLASPAAEEALAAALQASYFAPNERTLPHYDEMMERLAHDAIAALRAANP